MGIRWPFTRRKQTVESKSLSAPSASLLEIFGASTDTAAGVAVSPAVALRCPAVLAAIRVISEAVATLPVRVVDVVTQQPVQHPAQALLAGDWNAWTTSYEGMVALVVDALSQDRGGIAWINRVGGRPIEMIRFNPSTITVEYNDVTGEPRYSISTASGSRPLEAADIVHLDPFRALGRCPLTLAREAIGLALTMEAHAGRLFGNGARPSGVLTVKGSMTADAITKIREAWTLAHGPGKSGGTAVVGSDATYTALTMTSVDSQFQELRTFQLQEIARAFRVPPHMLYDLGRATWGNSEQMGLEFLSYTLQPWLDAIKGALQRALFTPDERQTLAIEFDTDDLTRADIGARAQAYSSLISARVLNPNEARRWEGLPAYEGGDAFSNPHITTGAGDAREA